ncbi:MAG TPA: NUMOD3 domain-containing DNA-binding protein [Candidatus Paceibacterota bacterium]|nr:NUMOD3 domain-containing DNA-binding protein [Candidatus Paceibacterota bacterium]
MFFYTYLTTNKINGKQYVGSHKSLLENDNYLGSGSLIRKALKKYGANNFSKKIIKYYHNIEDARNGERILIENYRTLNPNGYNISPFGGTSNGGHSEKTKEKIRKNNIGKHNHEGPWTGKKRSEETKKKISLSLNGVESPMKGKKHREETKQKISLSRTGISSWDGKSHTPDSRKRISESLIGRKQSEGTRRKRSESMKKYWDSKNK